MKSIKNKTVVFFFVSVLFFVIDRFLKAFVLNSSFKTFELIKGLVFFDFVKNYNIAFSLPVHGYLLEVFIATIIIILFYILIQSVKNYDIYQSFFIFLAILGAVSNLIDRLKFGFVIDYINFIYFPVFNIADSMIVCGLLLFIAKTFKSSREINS